MVIYHLKNEIQQEKGTCCLIKPLLFYISVYINVLYYTVLYYTVNWIFYHRLVPEKHENAASVAAWKRKLTLKSDLV